MKKKHDNELAVIFLLRPEICSFNTVDGESQIQKFGYQILDQITEIFDILWPIWFEF